MTDEHRTAGINDAIARCTAVLSFLEDLGNDGEDLGVELASPLATLASGYIEDLRRAFHAAKATTATPEANPKPAAGLVHGTSLARGIADVTAGRTHRRDDLLDEGTDEPSVTTPKGEGDHHA